MVNYCAIRSTGWLPCRVLSQHSVVHAANEARRAGVPPPAVQKTPHALSDLKLVRYLVDDGTMLVPSLSWQMVVRITGK